MSAKLNFLNYDYLAQSVTASLQHSKTYKAHVTPADRDNFRTSLRRQLHGMASRGYNTMEVDDDTHVENICNLSRTLSDRHRDILEGKRFRIGSAQKALNLYLKYLWCQGEIQTPPHCPLDAGVIATLSAAHRKCLWTQLDDIVKYNSMIADAKINAKATGISLAEWELNLWNKTYVD
jgi:hypothetical protein